MSASETSLNSSESTSHLERKNLRIAWLLPVTWFYWQPSISELAQLYPNTKVFTALWPGFTKGYEDKLDVEVIGDWKVVKLSETEGGKGYGSSITYVSPKVLFPLLKFRPQVVFSSSFGLWTLMALLLKPLGGWRTIVAYEGSSPGVDFRNSPARLALRRFMISMADLSITNSLKGKEYLVDVLNVEPDRVRVFPYEVPAAESLFPDKASEDTNIAISDMTRPIFLFVGRIVARKGVRILLDACAELKEQGCDRFTLAIVGDGEEREELQSLTVERQLQSCVHWIGRVPYEQISIYFQQADVFVLPTYEDTWGVVTLEAMLFGKPVLCSSGAGTSELIVDGQNGFVFDTDDSAALVQHMRYFIEHPDKIAAMGESSRRIMGEYTPQASAQFLANAAKDA